MDAWNLLTRMRERAPGSHSWRRHRFKQRLPCAIELQCSERVAQTSRTNLHDDSLCIQRWLLAVAHRAAAHHFSHVYMTPCRAFSLDPTNSSPPMAVLGPRYGRATNARRGRSSTAGDARCFTQRADSCRSRCHLPTAVYIVYTAAVWPQRSRFILSDAAWPAARDACAVVSRVHCCRQDQR